MSDAQRQARFNTYFLVITVAAAMAFARIATVSGVYVAALGERARTPDYSPIQSQNDLSRWCLVWSLAERGTFQIDEIMNEPAWYTIDHVQKDGHFYSTKPPLLPVLVSGLYWVIKQLTGWTLLTDTHAVVQSILLIVNWMPMLISLLLFVRMAERYAQSDWARLYLVVAAAAGTFLTTFVATFNNHTVAAASALFSIYAALRVFDGERAPGLFIIAGFFAAFAVANDLPAALYALALLGMLARVSWRRALFWFLPAAAVPMIGSLAANYLETGGMKPLYAYFGTEYYNYTLNGQQSYWSNPQGIDRGLDSLPVYLLHMTIGHHGILSLTPMFLLTAAGWFQINRPEARQLRHVLILTCVLTLAMLDFYLTRTESYNYGGVTAGLRWLFWLIPLWLIGMIPALDAWGERRWFRWLSAGLLAVSVFSATWGDKNPWQHPWLFELMESWGWTHYRS